MSRDKGARVERLLVAELIRNGWSDVVRVPLSGAVKSRTEYEDDVAARPPGWGTELRFECKARRSGFDKLYSVLPDSSVKFSVSFPSGTCLVLSLSPADLLRSVSHQPIEAFPSHIQKALVFALKKCTDWIGNAQVLALKQDRKPFIYVRFRR